MLKSAEMYSFPLRQQNKDHLALSDNVRGPTNEWYGDVSDHSRVVISSLDSLLIHGAAVGASSEEHTSRRLSSALATRSARTPAESLISARHAVVARRRYQVMTAEYSFFPHGTPPREAISSGKPRFEAFTRGNTASSPRRQNTTIAPTVVSGSHSVVQTHFVPLLSSPRLNSSSLYPEQHRPQTASGRKVVESKKNDESLMTSSNDLSNTDDGWSAQVKISKQRVGLSSKTARPCLGQPKDTQQNIRRLFSMTMEEPFPQQSVQKVMTPAARSVHLADFCDMANTSRPMRSTEHGGSQQNNTNSPFYRESFLCHDRFCGGKSHEKKTIATPSFCVQSPLCSAPAQFSLVCGGGGGHRTLSSTKTTTAAQGSARMATAHGQSDECNRSSTDVLNVVPTGSFSAAFLNCQSIYSFVSCRPLVCHFVQRWRNRYEESKSAYSEGGYLAVTPGKKLNSRYVVVHKLGWGEFSTVWLAYDALQKTSGKSYQPFVALKIAKCDSSVSVSTQYEIDLLRYISMQSHPATPLTGLLDCFEVTGQYGSHMCMVMPLHGSNLLSIIDQIKGKKGMRSGQEIRLIKEIVASVLLGLQELDRLDIIHTDIKPENILFSSPDPKVLDIIGSFCKRNKERSSMVSFETLQEYALKGDPNHLVCIADFGLSVALRPSTSASAISCRAKSCQALLNSLIGGKKEFIVEKPGTVTNIRGTMIQTREYRAPETIIGLDFNTRTDLWSVGCMVFELITGEFLMDPKRRTKNERMMDVEHLAMIMQLLGPVPNEIVQLRTEKNVHRPPPRYIHRYFNEHGEFIYAEKYRLYQRRHLDKELGSFLPPAEAKAAAAFIMRCLSSYDPAKRPSAAELFEDEWLLEVMGQRAA